MTETRILCYGEIDLDIYLALDRLPTRELSAWTLDEFENVGGAAANSALWLANWGLPVRLAGHDLGADAPGAAVREVFARYPLLDARFVATHEGYRTPRCQCLVLPDGERSFISHWLDDMRMTAVTDAMLDGIDWINLDMSGPDEARVQAAQLAKSKAASVLVNDIYRADHAMLPYVDVLVMSAAVARSKASAHDPLDLALDLGAAGDCAVIVTDSSAPVTIVERDGKRSCILPPTVNALDTTGAGDIFKSGLLYGLLAGLPLPEAARWGVAAGSVCCQYAGTTQTLAPLAEVRAMLAHF
ncbi:MAG: carbohydrate kinase family protein [Chloroflexi bacterium]|nr:carbohydrate kinase family protein [Chloroflexota bacterium]MCY3583626.1 carbohydrate kinase family protein [Chloroflexota bacterium]MCY3715903.1 carbohydrate kinase family protein [Chloroflexota bacterium]MDE2650062.1 carbohydrate kinase family protein [Chloroflexota bacterium]MXX83666.1 carbohydrate kinase family protein [Chloroflexota bacterium]